MAIKAADGAIAGVVAQMGEEKTLLLLRFALRRTAQCFRVTLCCCAKVHSLGFTIEDDVEDNRLTYGQVATPYS